MHTQQHAWSVSLEKRLHQVRMLECCLHGQAGGRQFGNGDDLATDKTVLLALMFAGMTSTEFFTSIFLPSPAGTKTMHS